MPESHLLAEILRWIFVISTIVFVGDFAVLYVTLFFYGEKSSDREQVELEIILFISWASVVLSYWPVRLIHPSFSGPPGEMISSFVGVLFLGLLAIGYHFISIPEPKE